MPLHYVPIPISYNLGGIKKSAFPEANANLHATISSEDWLNSRVCPVVSYLFAVASCRWVTLSFISATFLILLLFVFALCESFSLPSCSQTCWLPLFIPLPVAWVSLQLADLQLTWAFASVEVYWSMKERGHGRAVLASCRPYEDWLSVLLEDLLVCVLVQQPPTLFSWALWREGCAVPKGAAPSSLGISTTGHCLAELSAYLEVLIKP